MQVGCVAVLYQTSTGKHPFEEWLEKIRHRDCGAAEAIDSRLVRIRDKGNFGDCRSIGQGVYELRIHLRPGYRVYYLRHGHNRVILLSGGEKGDQDRDIEKAHGYATDFRRRI
jgi:putative addiction module killer protein